MYNEFLKLIDVDKNIIDDLLANKNLTKEEITMVKKYNTIICSYIAYTQIIEAQEKKVADDDKDLKEKRRIATDIYKDVKSIQNKYAKTNSSKDNSQANNEPKKLGEGKKTTTKAIAKREKIDSNPQKKNDQKENESKKEKLKNGLKFAIIVGIASGIAFGVGRCSKKNKTTKDDITTEPSTSISQSVETTTKAEDSKQININDIDLDNEESLQELVNVLKEEYPEIADMDDEKIIDAIRLANFDKLQDQAVFYSNEQALEAILNIGKLGTTIGSDNFVKKDGTEDIYISADTFKTVLGIQNQGITISDFEDAKTKNGYDVLKILEKCTKKVKSNDANAKGYADIINEITTGIEVTYSICNKDISTIYTVAGYFNDANTAKEKDEGTVIKYTANTGEKEKYGLLTSYQTEPGKEDICAEQIYYLVTIDGDISDNIIFTQILSDKVVKGNTRQRVRG